MKKILKILVVFAFIITTSNMFSVEAAASKVGELTIFAANDGSSSSLSTSGHAFISFKNTSGSNITVGGLSVKNTHEITIGTWGNKSQHKGIWYNLESYFVNNVSAYSNRVSLTTNVTQANIDTINSLISSNDKWSATNNCSSFATKIWNSVSSTTLSAGTPNTPTALMKSIKSKSGYSTKKSIQNISPIGYVSGGKFYTVSSSDISRSLLFSDLIETAEGGEDFLIGVDMNPNSMY